MNRTGLTLGILRYFTYRMYFVFHFWVILLCRESISVPLCMLILFFFPQNFLCLNLMLNCSIWVTWSLNILVIAFSFYWCGHKSKYKKKKFPHLGPSISMKTILFASKNFRDKLIAILTFYFTCKICHFQTCDSSRFNLNHSDFFSWNLVKFR